MDNELKFNIIIIVILFFILLFVCAIFSTIFYFLIKFLRKKLNWNHKYLSKKYLTLFLSILSILFSVYQSITAVYPNDNFYFDEFEYVTNRKIPKSAEIKNKESSYPDFHGDYFSKSIIELSNNDYDKLLKDLENDKTLIETNGTENNEFKVFERKIKGESDRFLFIKFLNDKKTIIVNVDFT